MAMISRWKYRERESKRERERKRVSSDPKFLTVRHEQSQSRSIVWRLPFLLLSSFPLIHKLQNSYISSQSWNKKLTAGSHSFHSVNSYQRPTSSDSATKYVFPSDKGILARHHCLILPLWSSQVFITNLCHFSYTCSSVIPPADSRNFDGRIERTTSQMSCHCLRRHPRSICTPWLPPSSAHRSNTNPLASALSSSNMLPLCSLFSLLA